MMQDGSKKVLDQYTGVYKYVSEEPGEASKNGARVSDQPMTPMITPTVDYSTKPKMADGNINQDSERAADVAFRKKSNLKRTMSIPNIVSLNGEFIPSESSESGRVCLRRYLFFF